MADWTAIYRISDGVLIGYGTVIPDPLPEGTAALTTGTRMDETHRWNPLTRDWVLIPPEVLIDRLQDLAGHPYLANVWQRLTTTQRQQLRKAVVWLLGSKRYRRQTEEVALDVDETWPTDPANAVE